MKWYKIAETDAKKADFLLLDLSYWLAFLELKKITGKIDGFLSYVDRKNNLVSEFMAESEKKRKALFGERFFLNGKKLKWYKKEIKEILGKIGNYQKEIKETDFNRADTEKIKTLFQRGKTLCGKALGLYLLSQPEYTVKLEQSAKDDLAETMPAEEINQTFNVLCLPIGPSRLNEERRKWLENVILPAVSKHRNLKEALKDKLIMKEIERHAGKYQYQSASVEFGLWNKNHYSRLLKKEFSKDERELKNELLEIKNRNAENKRRKKELAKKFKLNKKILRKTKTISELGLLRINLRLGWQFFNWLFPEMARSIAARSGMKPEETGALDNDEFTGLLGEKTELKNIRKLVRARKNKNILILISRRNGYKKFFGRQADKKFKLIVKRERTGKMKELKGVTANGRGKIIGKAFVFKWGEKNFDKKIYEFPAERILVVGQTRPLLMPAIRKAKAIITDEGGILCHAAIVSRELGIPCIIGTKFATRLFHSGDLVEIDADKETAKIVRKAEC